MNLLRTSLIAGGAIAIKAAIGFLTNKLFAIFLGPEGFAILANFQNLITLYSRACTGAIETGIVNTIAGNRNSEDRDETKIVQCSVFIFLSMSLISGVALLSTQDAWMPHTLLNGHHQSNLLILAILISGPIFGAASLSTALTNGFKKVQNFALANGIASISCLGFALALTPSGLIEGAVISLTLAQLVYLLTSLGLLRIGKSIDLNAFFPAFHKNYARQLLHFSTMTFVSIATTSILMIMLRKLAADHFSVGDAGAWQGVWKIGETVNSLAFAAVSFYFIPKFGELARIKIPTREILAFSAAMAPIYAILAALSYVYSAEILSSFYSTEFTTASGLLWIQIAGCSIQIVAWLMGSLVVSMRMSKSHFVIQNVSVLGTYVFSFLFIKYYGLNGMAYGFLAGNLLLLVSNGTAIIVAGRQRNREFVHWL